MSGVEQAASEGSVPYDPQTNGAAENAGRLVKGQFRTLLLGLERQLKARIPLTHPIISWLVAHSAVVRNLQVQGEDGFTPFQRARGTSGPQKFVQFGKSAGIRPGPMKAALGSPDGDGVWESGLDSNAAQDSTSSMTKRWGE